MVNYVHIMNNDLIGRTLESKEPRANKLEPLKPTHKDEVFLKETKSMLDLKALEEIEKNPKISQRELSNHLGVALGITNSLLKNLVHKGLLKIRGENNRSLTYHLTHAGVLAKSRLAMRWTLNTIDFYRQVRQDVTNKLTALTEQGIKSVALYGVGEVTEIAIIVASEIGLNIVSVIDGLENQNHDNARTILRYPIVSLTSIENDQLDAIITCIEIDGEGLEALHHYVNAGTQVCRLI